MSDSELEFENDDDEEFQEDHGDENGPERSFSSQKMNIENSFYEAEDIVKRQPKEATDIFISLLDNIEQETATWGADTEKMTVLEEWRAKTLTNLIKAGFCLTTRRRLQLFDQLVDCLRKIPRENPSILISAIEGLEYNVPPEETKETSDLLLLSYMKAQEITLLWESSKLKHRVDVKIARVLLGRQDFDRLKTWIDTLYLDWAFARSDMTVRAEMNEGAFFKVLHKCCPSDCTELFELIALELRLNAEIGCSSEHSDWRIKRLLGKCQYLSRALLDKRTTAIINSRLGQMHILNGNFSEAYTSYYDAWEITFELGDIPAASHLLMNLSVCNLMSESKVDALSSREAQTLLNRSDADETMFKRTMGWIEQLKDARNQNDCQGICKLFNEGSFLRDGIFGESDLESTLLWQVRLSRFQSILSRWSCLRFSWLSSQLALADDELNGFLVAASQHCPNIAMRIDLTRCAVQVTRDSSAFRTGRELASVCRNLARAINKYHRTAPLPLDNPI